MQDRRPTEKKINSQHELVCFQAKCIATDLQARVRRMSFVDSPDDLERLLRGIRAFQETLDLLKKHVQEAES